MILSFQFYIDVKILQNWNKCFMIIYILGYTYKFYCLHVYCHTHPNSPPPPPQFFLSEIPQKFFFLIYLKKRNFIYNLPVKFKNCWSCYIKPVFFLVLPYDYKTDISYTCSRYSLPLIKLLPPKPTHIIRTDFRSMWEIVKYY
jgi:hypothetical protein